MIGLLHILNEVILSHKTELSRGNVDQISYIYQAEGRPPLRAVPLAGVLIRRRM